MGDKIFQGGPNISSKNGPGVHFLGGPFISLCTYQYYPPSWVRVGEWWGFEFLKSQIPHPWGMKSIHLEK